LLTVFFLAFWASGCSPFLFFFIYLLSGWLADTGSLAWTLFYYLLALLV
jgi:hypothetical protein